VKAIELSPRAERSLDDILTYSRARFGDPRARRYAKGLMDRCRMVAKGHLVHQSCRSFFAEDLHEDLRFIRAGQHFVVFIERGNRIVIVDFLHQSADIGNRLEGTPE
jgi:toxin ParE1/3/4